MKASAEHDGGHSIDYSILFLLIFMKKEFHVPIMTFNEADLVNEG